MAEKLFKKDLAEKLAEQFDITKKVASQYVDFLAETVVEELKNGNSITVKEIGKFDVVTKKARTGINPKTKETVTIPAKKAVTFKAAKSLKEEIQ